MHLLPKLIFSVIFGVACSSVQAQIDSARLGLFQKLPSAMESVANPITEEKVRLGRMLFFDKRLSKNHDLSCNSCHGLETFGVDNKPLSNGHLDQLGGRNSPSVYNAAGHVAQFWDGRAVDVEEQAKGPVLNPVEMAMPSEAAVLKVLNSIPEYVEAFQSAFPEKKDSVTYDNFGKAIGAFERNLTTPGRWDEFLAGNQASLSKAEQDGLVVFLDAGCGACHMGPYLGGLIYQKLGLIKPWPDLSDLGRFDVTGQEYDKLFFKVPSLRNIAETAPYLHDGSVETLDEMVFLMAEYQTGNKLSLSQVESVVEFLRALTGEIPEKYIAQPELPLSSATTPGPVAP
jgi:cytochrome c peroxidase